MPQLESGAFMLQPRTYPELLGKALFLDAEPFITMTDDDNPWVEGMFLVALVGFAAGIAKMIGGWLTLASAPAAGAMLEAVLPAWRALGPLIPLGEPALTEADFRQIWSVASGAFAIAGRSSQIMVLVITPTVLLAQWLLVGAVSFAAARWLGGRGTLNQTLGATALFVAPQLLNLVSAAPFVQVSGLLLTTWGLLIAYRGLEVAHELPWQRAAIAALAAPALGLLLMLGTVSMIGLALLAGGGL
jgi:hypothetical protein